MIKDLNVGSWVIIRKGCPIAYSTNSHDEIEFMFGTRQDGFEFVFDADALRAFVESANDALADLG